MPDRAKQRLWSRTKRLTLVLLAVWLTVNLLVPWFARDLNRLQFFGFPLGFWFAAEGALLIYMLIIVVYVVAMDRLEAAYESERRAATPDDEGAGPP